MIKTLRFIKKKNKKRSFRLKRKISVRKNISGSADKPRLCVFKSLRHIYAQVIDDSVGTTIVSSNSLEKELHSQAGQVEKLKVASLVGDLLGQRLKKKKVKKVVFDRNGFHYTGRIAALADAVRKQGLQF